MNKMNKIYDPLHVGSRDVWTVEIETGVQLKELDNYLKKHDPPLALASNVIVETVRFGGVLSLGCHGAGTQSRTLPDLVETVKIVDASGQLNVFTKEVDPVEFSAATLNLGLLGIIYSYTLRVEPMYKLHMKNTFPLLSEYFSSPEISGPKLKALVESSDQTEIFFLPFNTTGLDASDGRRLWVIQSQRTEELPVTESSKQRSLRKRIQRICRVLGINIFRAMLALPSLTSSLSTLMYSSMLKETDEVLLAPDAIHYLSKIARVKSVDMEFAFKVGENYENVIKAWNFVIEQMYEHAQRGEFPFIMPPEMRFAKASKMIMSNVYDDDPEAIYCMMEVLSPKHTKG
ncbi:hypothetical protein BGZ65_011780, partial [Modicella reniformis]